MRKATAKQKEATKPKVATKSKRPVKRKRGRPTRYTNQLADEICAQLAEGLSLRKVCDKPDMPNRSTVFRWLRNQEDFRDQYGYAKVESADALFEEVLDIADNGTNDWMEKLDKDGSCIGWQVNGENIQRSRLRVDARKWMMSKLKPKKYGERQQHDVAMPHSIEDFVLGKMAKRVANG